MSWQQQLQNYYDRYKYNFVVQKIADFPYPWINYKTPEYEEFITKEGYVSQREVFPDEVVFDIDMKSDVSKSLLVATSQEMGLRIVDKLVKEKINYKLWTSGGSGSHIHCFFPELNNLTHQDRFLMKKIIIRYFARGMLYMRSDDLGKVQTQTLTTIQIEDAIHRKGGVKSFIQGTEFIDSKIPIFLYDELTAYKKQYQDLYDKINRDVNKTKPKVISYLESLEFAKLGEGRKRAMFALCAYYKKIYDDDDVLELMNIWNSKVLNNYLSQKQIRATCKSTHGGFVANYINELFDDLNLDVDKI